MFTLVMCGPMIYRTALLEQLRMARGDVRVAAQSNHMSDAPALAAAATPDAVLVISAADAATVRREVERLRKVDLDVRLVWWALRSDADELARDLVSLDVAVVSWEASADELLNATGIPRMASLTTISRPRLTQQEHLILQLAAEGLSNRAIAFRLGVAENTVKNHFRHIGAKFNTSSRAQAVWQAVQWGYLKPIAARA